MVFIKRGLEFPSAMAARSFTTTVNTPDGLVRPMAAARADVSSPSGGLVFVSGALTQELGRVADHVHATWRHLPVCIVPGAGVLTERGEVEGASAAAGLLWSGGRTEPLLVSEGGDGAALRDALAGASKGRATTVMLFARSDYATDLLGGISAEQVAPNLCLFGAGTVGAAAITVTASGELLRGRAAGLAIQGLAPPIVDSSPACRLLTPLRAVDDAASGMLLSIGGTPALDVLSACMPEIRSAAQGSPQQPQPVVFVALAEADEDRFVIRPVRGVDAMRRGVMVGPEAEPGVRAAFAVRDAAAARAGLEAVARNVAQQSMGAAPRFALFLTCAGRGQGLYGVPDVESRILRQRFGDLPIAGMHAAFEIVPWGPGAARLALYTGALALFRSPS